MVGGGPFGQPPLLFLLAFLPALWTIWAIWPTGRVVFAGVFAWALGHLTQITVYGLFPDPQRLRDLPVADLRLQCLDRRRRMKWRKCATGRQRTPTATRAAEVEADLPRAVCRRPVRGGEEAVSRQRRLPAVALLHIALPDVLDPEKRIEIGYYGLGLRSGAKPAHSELTIEDYIAELEVGDFSQIADMAALRASHEVRAIVDGEGDKKRKRKIYDCFVFEVEHKGTIYVLFGGEWFAIDKAFHLSVEAGFLRLVSKTPFVLSTSKANEREFIAELDGQKNLLNMDQVKLNPAGMGGASLEPCDFLSTDRQFIHLKDGHGSAPISHLWNQGVVSAEAFIRDEKFRKDFRAAAQRRQKKSKKSGFEKLLPDGRSKPVPSDFTVVYGVMRSRYMKSGTLGLPFFSKISLRAIADRIELMGYKVEVHLIEKLTATAAHKPVAKAA
jgi:hypothetical protein